MIARGVRFQPWCREAPRRRGSTTRRGDEVVAEFRGNSREIGDSPG
jgi:hypothetical protein